MTIIEIMIKIAYITTQLPWGHKEHFVILEEMLALKDLEVELLVIPRNPSKKIFHKEAKYLLNNSMHLPIVNIITLFVFLYHLFMNPKIWEIIIFLFRYSRNVYVLIKNLVVLPKAVYLSDIIKREKVKHIHAHWGSTTATMACVISKLSGIPWSFTLHRWDIRENNMLKEKAESAKFVRCISDNGKCELLKIVGVRFQNKIRIIHTGVKIPTEIIKSKKDKKIIKIIMPANFIEVKGHRYLIEACSMLVLQNIDNFRCIFYGKGPGKKKLKEIIMKKKLNNYIKVLNFLPHNELIEMYKNSEVDMVVLPSISNLKGEHEGIPVALMEAMSYSIPVISTNTGGIPELISKNIGIMVNEKDPIQLADAIKKLLKDEKLRMKIGKDGYKKVYKEYNIKKNTMRLFSLFNYYS